MIRLLIAICLVAFVGCSQPAKEATKSEKQQNFKGYICPCGSLCAAREGGICQGHCGCPIGH